MESSFPFSCTEKLEIPGVISIQTNKLSHFIAYLTRDSVLIHDLDTLNNNFVSKYVRSAESLSEFGMNHWMQWITSTDLAFGTCSGQIFISKIDKNGIISDPIETKVRGIITSTFCGNGTLGICLSSMEILLLGTDGKIRSGIRLKETGSGIKCAKFYAPTLLVGIIDRRAFRIHLTRSVLMKVSEPVVSFMPFTDVDLVTQIMNKSFVCVSRGRGDLIVAAQQNEAHGAHIIQESPEGCEFSEILFAEFSSNSGVLYVIRRNGDIVMWNSATAIVNTINVPALKESTNYAFDNQDRRLFFEAKGHIHILDFIKFNSFVGVTSNEAYLLSPIPQSHPQKIFSFDDHPLYESIFPFDGASYVVNDKAILYNKNGFFLIDTITHEISPVINVNVVHIGSTMGTIIVVSKEENNEYFVIFYDMNGNRLQQFPLEHVPLTMNICRNRIIVTANTKFTVFKLSKDSEYEDSFMLNDEKIYVSIKIYLSTEQIRDAVTTSVTKNLMLYVNGTVRVRGSRDILKEGIEKIWYESRNDLTVMIKPMEYTLYFNKQVYNFKGCALFTDGSYLYSVLPNIELGKINFRCDNFFPFIVDSFIDDRVELCNALRYFDHSPQFSTLLAFTFIFYAETKRLDTLFKQMAIFQPPSIGAIMNSLSIVARNETKEVIVNAQFEWDLIIPFCDSTTKKMVLSFLNPEKFDSLMDKADTWKKSVSKSVAEELTVEFLDKERFGRALRIACEFDVDMQLLAKKCEQYSEKTLENITEIVINDAKNWISATKVIKQGLRYLCSLLITENNINLAFALFVANGDTQKVASLLAMSDELNNNAKKLTITNNKAKKTLEAAFEQL